jgi:hypothetical protein
MLIKSEQQIINEFLEACQNEMPEVVLEIMNEVNAQLIFESQAKTLGWTYAEHVCDTDAVDLWLEQHCQHQYKKRDQQLIFESTQDAVMFTLKWTQA